MRLTRRTALAAPFALAACTGREHVALPFHEANDHVVAPVSVEGRTTIALIDNGAPLSSLDQIFATGLPRDAAGSGLRPLSMTLAAATLPLHPFTEDMAEAAIAADAPLGALIGMELFNAFVVGFSFTTGTMTLDRRGTFSPTPDAHVFATDQGPTPHPAMPVSIEGVQATAFIDLGCSAALAISSALAARIGLNDGRQSSSRQVILSDASGLGLGVSRLTSLKIVEFAGRTFRDVPVDVLPENATAFVGLDAVVGIPLLRRFDLTLDIPRSIALAPNARLEIPFERRMTGLQTRPYGANLLIRHVAVGSPGERAGFAPGDQIAAIDGAAPLMRTLRNAAEGQVLAITLAGGETRRLTGARYY